MNLIFFMDIEIVWVRSLAHLPIKVIECRFDLIYLFREEEWETMDPNVHRYITSIMKSPKVVQTTSFHKTKQTMSLIVIFQW